MTSPSPLSRTLWPAATGSGRIAQQVNININIVCEQNISVQMNPVEPLPFKLFAKNTFSESTRACCMVSVCEVILVKYLGLDLNIKTICVQLESFKCDCELQSFKFAQFALDMVSCLISCSEWRGREDVRLRGRRQKCSSYTFNTFNYRVSVATTS